MTQKKGKGRAGDDLAQLRGQLGRGSSQAQPATNSEQTHHETQSESRQSSASSSSSSQEKPRRITVDLDAERHRVLREFAFSERTKGTEVLRGLLDILRDEPDVANELRKRINTAAGH